MLDVNNRYRKLMFLLFWLFSFIPISGYLFGNGYLNYYNPEFPFFSGYEVKYLYPLFTYSPETGVSPNVQSVLYSFMYLIPSDNVIVLAKIYLILMFSIIYVILWKLTDLILSVLKIYNFSIKILLILFFYLFPLYIQFIASDWFNVILGVLALTFVLINLTNVQLNNVNLSKEALILSGIALGFSAMMDPRFYIWFIYILIILVSFSVFEFRRSFLKIIKNLAGIFLTSLPFLLYTYYIFIYPSLITKSLAKAASFSALRPDSLSYIAGFSQNAGFPNLFAFISSWWPFVIPSSPSILFYPRDEWFYLPAYGFNDQMLFPNDFVSYLWVSSLFIFIFIAVISLFDKSRKLISAELLLILLFMIGIESGTNFPFKEFTYIFDVLPSKLPIVGGIMSTTFAIPFYAEWTNVSISLILGAIGLNYILNKFKQIKIKYIIGIVLILIMSFASWQYFDGTLYPSQHDGAFPGNGVSLEGYYYPLNPPSQWVHVMNLLSTSTAGVAYVGEGGFSEKWTNYQFISLSPPLMPGYETISSPQTTYVNQTPLAYDIAGIKYLFIDNTSYIPISNSFIYSYLNSSGLKLIYAKGNVYLLEQPNASVFREAKMGIYVNSSNETILFNAECLLYPLLDYTPAIISPLKTNDTVNMLLNPCIDNGNYISLFNESANLTVLHGSYIIDQKGNISNIDILNKEKLNVRPWTIIIPENLNLANLVSKPINFSFNQLTAQFSIKSSPDYLVETSLPLPYGGVQVSNGKTLGTNVFGQHVLISKGKSTVSLKLGFITNLLIITVDIFFYALFIYLIIYRNLFNGSIERIINNVIIRLGRLKSN
ncbi:hypothetical protein IC006_0477 [Sulfuracidifex tepidarius]|uniref:Membrane protein 6-pyruvoyl-tetrahydropterin synthase-related domain-containing protein n=1 Tax=Sulfuracidifex tepidarius TaxID=1294262 RepID=A0A510DSN9_9CREN|nr:hypothetical protein [Sulfuracidifex tepidarius]BBG23193.1 hypothetical protein IC006_0477 [Sulfuracidifex tepidarius]